MKDEYAERVLEVRSISDRVMSVKLEVEGEMINVVSAYAPQVGFEVDGKEEFWSELDEVMESAQRVERVVIGADLSGHVGEGYKGDKEVIGEYGIRERNIEEQIIVDFAKRMGMTVVNSCFTKKEEHRVAYKSGGRFTQVDYILWQRGRLKETGDCKVVAGENVAKQHLVVIRMDIKKKKKGKVVKGESKVRWWKLEMNDCSTKFKEEVMRAVGGAEELPDELEVSAAVVRETARKVLGVSSGQKIEDNETCWWNESAIAKVRT